MFSLPLDIRVKSQNMAREAKRQQRDVKDNGKNSSVKRQRQQSFEEPLEQLKLTNINRDCLEHMFEYLNLCDLLNVADSSKSLRVAAGLVYHRKFRQQTVQLYQMISNLPGHIYNEHGTPYIGGLRTCLRFVRCFGSHISKLEITYCHSSRKDNNYLDRYVNEFCADTLIELNYVRKPTILLDIPKKPFTNVQILRIIDSNLNYSMEEIVGWFPNLRDLRLHLNQIVGSSIEKKIPHLEHLSLTMDSTKKRTGIGHKNIIRAVSLNPQLRGLYIMELDQEYLFKNLLEIASSLNPIRITSLTISDTSVLSPVNREEILDLQKALPLLERLYMNSYLLQPDHVIEFISRAKQLDKFAFNLVEPWEQQFDILNANLGKEWHFDKSSGHIILTKLN